MGVRDVMRRRQVLVFAAGAAALLGVAPPTVPGAAAAVRAAGSWGRAITVPGLRALNTGRNASVLSVSCPSPGNCAAGGFYRNHGIQGFVVSKRNGRWRRAIEVPGLGALNKGRQAEVLSVSCASPGRCAVGGYYGNHGPNPYDVTSGRGFVAVEVNGRWRRAVEVPGLAALSRGGNAEVLSVSCASPGNCAAGGGYRDGGARQQGFVVSEKNGSWGTAQEVARNLNTGPGAGAGVETVSCASAGNCSAGGFYEDSSGNQAFVISEVNGTWAAAREVAGSLNSNGLAQVTSVSCASAGNCSAGGTYDYGGYFAAFVVSEKNGVWGKAIDVPGLRHVARDANLSSVSCASAGNCAAGGSWDGDGSGAWVVREKNGVWGKETTVPGLSALNKGIAGVSSVSCASAGSCVAGGNYQVTGRFALQGFVT
jgi:hypothetical protein